MSGVSEYYLAAVARAEELQKRVKELEAEQQEALDWLLGEADTGDHSVVSAARLANRVLMQKAERIAELEAQMEKMAPYNPFVDPYSEENSQ